MEKKGALSRDILKSFGESIDAQNDEPLNVGAEFDNLKVSLAKHLQETAAKLVTELISTPFDSVIDKRKNKVCRGLQNRIDECSAEGGCLYNCRSDIPATCCTDISPHTVKAFKTYEGDSDGDDDVEGKKRKADKGDLWICNSSIT